MFIIPVLIGAASAAVTLGAEVGIDKAIQKKKETRTRDEKIDRLLASMSLAISGINNMATAVQNRQNVQQATPFYPNQQYQAPPQPAPQYQVPPQQVQQPMPQYQVPPQPAAQYQTPPQVVPPVPVAPPTADVFEDIAAAAEPVDAEVVTPDQTAVPPVPPPPQAGNQNNKKKR